MKFFRRIALAISMLGFAIILSIPSTPSTQAGNNGQQIQVDLCSMYREGRFDPEIQSALLRVSGDNQHGRYTSLTEWYPHRGCYIYMKNKWWKGKVKVQIRAIVWRPGRGDIREDIFCHTYVDRSQWSNWHTIRRFNHNSGECS